MAFSLGEYQDIFLEEADDQLQELNKSLLEMEQNPDDEDTINNIFRAAHSLKSSAAFVGLNDLSELAHKMENLLQGVRDKTMRITPEIIDLLFKSFDYINAVIDLVSQGLEPDVDLTDIINEMKDLQDSSDQTNAQTQTTAHSEIVKTESSTLERISFTSHERRHLKRGIEEELSCYELVIFIEPDAPMKWVKAQLILNNLKNIAQIVKTVPDDENLTDDNIKDLIRVVILTDEDLYDVRNASDVDLVTKIEVMQIFLEKKDEKYIMSFGDRVSLSNDDSDETVEEEQPEPEIIEEVKVTKMTPRLQDDTESDFIEELDSQSQQRKNKKEVTSRAGSPSLRTVKVSVDKLDDLLNNVGELVIANSGFFRMYEDLKKLKLGKKIGNDFKNRMETMARIAKDLQSGIMKTRMVPIGQVFSRFHRLTRDLAKDTGKNVQLVTKGEDTELDKKVIDVIGEPLMHMVRNSVDHAIESPEERASSKKSEVGTITLSAHQGGNQIFVEVIDDGRGLDINKIKAKAMERNLATVEQLNTMEENEIFSFIFHPGFSTAAKITDVSGRGVGMNVVKEVVEEMGGNINIESEIGMGTRFIMSFPLTLAIIPAIMIKVAVETYAIPLTDVIETVNIDKKDITTIEGHEVINLRGEILSLVRLNNFVGIRSRNVAEEDIPVVVVGYSNRKIGLIVDELEGKLEIVIKSLENNYKTVEGLAGASILGDGSIALILDVSSMINRVIAEQEKLSHEEKLEQIRKQEQQFDEVEEENKQYTELTQTQNAIDDGSIDLSETEETSESYDDIYKLKEQDDVSPAEPLVENKNVEPELKTEPETTEDIVGVKTSITAETSEVSRINESSSKPEIQEKTKLVDQTDTYSDTIQDQPDMEIIEDTEVEVEESEISIGDDVIEVEDEIIDDIELDDLDPLEDDEIEVAIEAEDITDTLKPVETTPVKESGLEVDPAVHDALTTFKNELKSNIRNTLKDSDPDGHIKKQLNLEESDLDKLKLLSNVGVTQAADSLSKIIGTRIDMAIPDVRLLPADQIVTTVSHNDTDVFMAVSMGIVGDIQGSVLFSIGENSGYQLIDDLYDLETGATKELDENGSSALKEITNIVGSSVINSISERTGLSILTEVPHLMHSKMSSVMEEVVKDYGLKNEYSLTMDTEFYYEDDRVMGHLLVLPKVASLRKIIDNLRNDG
jgi:two-component system chemotaxis sensor kinase CheA